MMYFIPMRRERGHLLCKHFFFFFFFLARYREKLIIVSYGEYFKYIDEMARSLDGFKILWRRKKWTLFPLTDTVWVMFYYIQLYICAFSFVSTYL